MDKMMKISMDKSRENIFFFHSLTISNLNRFNRMQMFCLKSEAANNQNKWIESDNDGVYRIGFIEMQWVHFGTLNAFELEMDCIN